MTKRYLAVLILLISACDLSESTSVAPIDVVFDAPLEESVVGARLGLHADDWDGYGEAVGVRGDVLVVGASEWNMYGSGSAYVYRYTDGEWREEARLTATGTAGEPQSRRFGASVAIGEGAIAIGAPGSEDPMAGVDTGAVYLFEQAGQTWVETAKLTPDRFNQDPIPPRNGWQTDFRRVRTFGAVIALDGDTLAAAGATETELVHVFRRGEDGWQEQARIPVPSIPERDLHVVSLALSGDTLALSAFYTPPQSNRSQVVQGSAAVYLFEREGDRWQESFRFMPEGAPELLFIRRNAIAGASVALGGPPGQANLLAIGLPGFPDWSGFGGTSEGDPDVPETPKSARETGAVYIFERAEGGWRQRATLRPAGWETPPGPGRDFPASESDFEYIVFNEDTSTFIPTGWVLGDRYSDNPGISFFGATVALDGNWLAVTAAYANTAYVFERQGQDWVYQFRATPGPEAWEDFGQVVKISGRTLLLGAPGEFGFSAYVFPLPDQ